MKEGKLGLSANKWIVVGLFIFILLIVFVIKLYVLFWGGAEKGERVRKEVSPYGNRILNIYKRPGNATTDFSVSVWSRDKKDEHRIFYQDYVEDVYILWKNKNVVYINGIRVDISKKKEVLVNDRGKSFYGTKKEDGITSLMEAAYYREQSEFDTLISKKVNIDAVNVEGLNAIDFAIRGNGKEYVGLRMIKKLYSEGCNLSEESIQVLMKPFLNQTEEGQCDYAIRKYIFQQAKREGKEIPRLKQKDQLFQDIAEGKYIEDITDTNIKDKDGNTLVAVAAGYGNNRMLKKLYKDGSVDIPNIYEQDILLYAIEKGELESVKYLLKRGNRSNDSLDVAAGTGNVKMVELILNYCDLADDWHLNRAAKEAIQNQANDVLKYLVSKMKDIDYHASDINTVLDEAKQQHNKEAIKIILNEY